MSALPSMPYFVDDYEAATVHLSFEEDGAYNRLLRLCWRSPNCSVPDDPDWLSRRLRCDRETFDRLIKPIIDEFFTRSRGRIFQKRLRAEFGYVKRLTQTRKEAGKSGGNAKARKNNKKEPSKASGLPEQKPSKTLAPTPTPTPTSLKKDPSTTLRSVDGSKESSDPGKSIGGEKPTQKQKRGARLPDDWEPSSQDRAFAQTQGLTDADTDREAIKFRNHWTAKAGKDAAKLDWHRTWQNWVLSDYGSANRSGPRQNGQPVGGGNRREPASFAEAAMRYAARNSPTNDVPE